MVFLPFYAILRAIPDKLGGVLFMFGAIAVLFVLPWLDKSPVRSSRFRPLYKVFLVIVTRLYCIRLFRCEASRGIYVILSRLATAYLFLSFFNCFTVASKNLEKTRPLPVSISKPILSASTPASVFALREKK